MTFYDSNIRTTTSSSSPSDDATNKALLSDIEFRSAFNKNAVQDFTHLLQLVYEYLSMPTLSHAQYIVFRCKQRPAQRVHAQLNDINKRINNAMFDLTLQVDAMRQYGFPSGEASRLLQYHSYLVQRFEQLRMLKYYRTPQATRAFSLVYFIVLPWISGPYFAWVFEETSGHLAFTLTLSAFTFLILLGLVNTYSGLEDPFVADQNSLIPGIDNLKLDFECATILQTIDQYNVNATRKLISQKRMLGLFNDEENTKIQETLSC